MMAEGKRTKESVNYTTHATNMTERCRLCKHFIDQRSLYGECDKVAGSISPVGWCELFERRREK